MTHLHRIEAVDMGARAGNSRGPLAIVAHCKTAVQAAEAAAVMRLAIVRIGIHSVRIRLALLHVIRGERHAASEALFGDVEHLEGRT